MDSEKKKVTTRQQFEYLVAWMEKHPNIAKGLRFGANYNGNKDDYKSRWLYLTTKLNNLGPPIRATSEWQKVWTDFKLKIKKKLYVNNIELNTGGEGPYKLHKMTSLEQRVVNFLPLKKIIRPAKHYDEPPPPPVVAPNMENLINIPTEVDIYLREDEISLATSTPVTTLSSEERKKERKGNDKNRKNTLKEIVASIKVDLRYTKKMYNLKREKFEFYKKAIEMREKRKLQELALKREILDYKNRKLELEEIKKKYVK